jgi:hypothetical protein
MGDNQQSNSDLQLLGVFIMLVSLARSETCRNIQFKRTFKIEARGANLAVSLEVPKGMLFKVVFLSTVTKK